MNSAERLISVLYRQGTAVVLDSRTGTAVRAEFLNELLMNASGRTERDRLSIRGATVSGQLDLSGMNVEAPITFEDCTFMGRLILRDATLTSLCICGESVCPGVDAGNLHVRRDLELIKRFTCLGELKLLGAQVDGKFSLTGAILQNIDADGGASRALYASRLNVRGAFFAENLVAHGQIRLISARVGGLLSFAGAQLHNPRGIALHGERLEAGESIFLKNGFSSCGRVILQNAVIKGGLDASGKATFRSGLSGGSCFQAVRASIGRNASFTDATVDGWMSFSHATASGLRFKRTSFLSGRSNLDLTQAKASTLDMSFARCPMKATLLFATVDVVDDDPKVWPGRLELRGFTYKVLKAKVSVEQRLQWLARDPSGYEPAPYDQLMSAYRAAGDEQSANRVGLEKQRQRRTTLGAWGRAVGRFLDITVGYGYQNQRAALAMLTLLCLGAVTFTIWRPQGDRFQPIVYTADLLLPIIDFGQAEKFTPGPYTQWVAWGLVASGWILTTAVVAGVTRFFNRR